MQTLHLDTMELWINYRPRTEVIKRVDVLLMVKKKSPVYQSPKHRRGRAPTL
jgi:hypothetical protein